MNSPVCTAPRQVLIFVLDEPRYALELERVERVVRAVEITRLPDTPPAFLGVINVQGEVTPVVDLRGRLGLPPQALTPDDRFVLARIRRHLVALVVDDIHELREVDEAALAQAEAALPAGGLLRGVVTIDDNLVLICDLDQFLAGDEKSALPPALAAQAAENEGDREPTTGMAV